MGYGGEIAQFYADEAAMIGAITILWNHHEDRLRAIFARILASPKEGYAEAIWDRQPTHQAKRNLLAMALDFGGLNDGQRDLLERVIEDTKTLADRRNDLLHGKYVVHGNTNNLFAVVRSPNSTKPAKYQKNTVNDLDKVSEALERLIDLAGYLNVSLLDEDGSLVQAIRALALQQKRSAPPHQSPPIDSPPPTGRRKRAPKQQPPPRPDGG
jgi:hypothetical protein